MIVESPAKAKTLGKYLGDDFRVQASVGHVKDLPEKSLGVDIKQDFRPHYVTLPGKTKILEQIRKDAAHAKQVFLAPDPDREGEAIAWHIAEDLREHGVKGEILRATFNEITKRAVLEGLAHPRELDRNLYEAQQARRILDRLVGYTISPLLGKKVLRGLSAGRVQSVAVRLIVEREREIRGFVPQEYWMVQAKCQAGSSAPFVMSLTSIDGEKRKIETEAEAREILCRLGATEINQSTQDSDSGATGGEKRIVLNAELKTRWKISNVERKEVRRRPPAPFITSTLQQEAARKLGMTARQTMRVAQQLYEGVELGELGVTGLITYMRTDSTRVASEALQAVRNFIAENFGAEYVPAQPNSFEKKKDAQDAHEAIRPTDLSLTPERVAPFLDKQQKRLYELIWHRFVASQMADAVLDQTRIECEPVKGLHFSSTGSTVKFAGFLATYVEGKDDGENGQNGEARLPALQVGDDVDVTLVEALQKFTQPPPRFTEATLVKELERLGIGRPSTYATIVSTIQDRKYVEKDSSKRFRPTEMGELVTDLLIEHFPDIMDVQFTAKMEEELDEVETGQKNWLEVLREFYARFAKQLEAAKLLMRDVKREAEETDILCDKCGQANMVIKLGRNGRFLACPRYPECKNTRNVEVQGQGAAAPPEVADEQCPTCGKPMVVRTGRFGRFLACSGYPECKTSKPLSTGVKCPECGSGELVEALAIKTKRTYWRCSNRECKFVLFSRPVAQSCPNCSQSFLVEHLRGAKRWLACPKCHYRTGDEKDMSELEAGTPFGPEPESPA
ncbi:MAG: type I DNA topoisomerase [Candidatus Sumerlaeaceae bacterium]|nr:type I DNA topoisomerase [Candidatus Sumerlaeaceae bacterium]